CRRDGWAGPSRRGSMASDIVAYGIYPDRLAFERALEALRAAVFRNSDISAILPDRDQTTRDLAPEINTKAPEGFTTGASTGAAIGGVVGGGVRHRRAPTHRIAPNLS